MIKKFKEYFIITFVALLITNNMLARDSKIFDARSGEILPIQTLVERTSDFKVIFFGEFHDDSIIHSIQEEYLREFIKANPKTIVSFEMFERDAQIWIDKYLNNDITEDEFLKNSRPWPDYKKFYKPLLELAKSNKLPVLAANIPRKYAALYSQKGLTGINKLPAEERIFITRDFLIQEDKYKEKFFATMNTNTGQEANFKMLPNEENTLYLYYGAQVIKDETMAESINDFLAKNPDYKVIHFNGDFHSNEYLGTVQKLLRRNPALKTAIITPDYVEEGKELKFSASYIGKTNFLILLHNFKREQFMEGMMGGGHLATNYVSSHKIQVDISPQISRIKGNDVITFNNPIIKKGHIEMLSDLSLLSISSPDGDITYTIEPINNNKYNRLIITPVNAEIQQVIIEYEGTVYNSPNNLSLNQRHSNSLGIISAKPNEGIYLPPGSYYPSTDDDIANFDIKVTLPPEFTVITSGKLINETISTEQNSTVKTYHYKSELPSDGFVLVGGKYIKKDTTHQGVQFSSYTFTESDHANTYLNESIKYYNLYTELLGSYPYSNFSIVENFFATGFGMPGYTLLSNKLMAMPWIVLTPGSLAHEFVHNWWGNSVYVNRKSGNWCEALTTYCTNYYYNVLSNNPNGALDWRKKALIALEALPKESSYPVSDFKYQSNNYDAVIGYQKGAFIFHEIAKIMGDSSFFKALRNFAEQYKGKRASWFALQMAFNRQAKTDGIKINLSSIINSWLRGNTIPTLKLDYISFDGDSIRFNINQNENYTSVVPVVLRTNVGEQKMYCTITQEKNRFSIQPKGIPISLQVDKDYEALRRLYKWEIPYSFNQTLANNPLIILPSQNSQDYKIALQLAEEMVEAEYNIEYKSIDKLQTQDWQNRTIIVVGNEKTNKFFNTFYEKYPKNINIQNGQITVDGNNYNYNGNLLLINMAHPSSPDNFAAVIYTDKMDNIAPFKRLFRYMSYSLIMLDKAKTGRPIAEKEIFPDIENNSELIYIFSKLTR